MSYFWLQSKSQTSSVSKDWAELYGRPQGTNVGLDFMSQAYRRISSSNVLNVGRGGQWAPSTLIEESHWSVYDLNNLNNRKNIMTKKRITKNMIKKNQ